MAINPPNGLPQIFHKFYWRIRQEITGKINLYDDFDYVVHANYVLTYIITNNPDNDKSNAL